VAAPFPIFALSTHGIDDAIYHVANVLEVPVLIAALIALAVVILELGSFLMEMRGRRRRRFATLRSDAEAARAALDRHDRAASETAALRIAKSSAMAGTIRFIVEQAGAPDGETQINKALADFDFDSERRLGRTRVLVRAGPALGLMGTLIPLSPALTGLASGNTLVLTQNLRLAFSVTVLGLLVGAVAFAISLYRDRMYSQDLSDLQYLAAILTGPAPAAPRPQPDPQPTLAQA
jgi:biopolymer transport protein ExbB/TolQ